MWLALYFCWTTAALGSIIEVAERIRIVTFCKAKVFLVRNYSGAGCGFYAL
jgi:hypothetical protein